jgi:hypothetical protein
MQKKRAQQKKSAGITTKSGRTVYVPKGGTAYIVHPGKPLHPDLQKIVDARAKVIAEDMNFEAGKKKSTVVYSPATRTAYRLDPGKPLPPELEEEVKMRAKKLADEIAQHQEDLRQKALQCQRAMTPDEITGAILKLVEYQGDDVQNMIVATVFKRLKRKREMDLTAHTHTLNQALENARNMERALDDLKNIEKGNFTILY